MSKRITLSNVLLGSDVTVLDFYHTSITASNLITSSISASYFASNSLTFDVPDTATTFIAECTSGDCFGQTGSLYIPPVDSNTTVYTLTSDGNGTVEITSPDSITATTASLEYGIDYNIYSSFTAEATPTYPFTFDGWYDAASSGTELSTSTTLTVTSGSFGGITSFYALFS